MSKRESIARYNLIIKKLRKHPASFAEISDYLAFESELQEYNFNISKRTFQRDLEDIRSLYNIDIQFDFSRKVYFLDFDEQPDVNNRILEAFNTFNALNLSDRLSNYIHFEKRRPQGTEYLYGLLHSIKNKLRIKFTYQKFWEDELTIRNVEPYALKEFKSRWYLIANDLGDNKIKTFGLDRFIDLDITKKPFIPNPEVNINDLYKNCFGIISSNNDKPSYIKLSFNNFTGKYIKSFPLHETQKIIEDNKKELIISLELFLTEDFYSEILSFGDNVTILEPEQMISEFKNIYKCALEKY